jgi:hypothetical protein
VADDHDVTEAGLLDVRDDGVHPLANGRGSEISRLGPVAGKIDRERAQIRCVSAQFDESGFPAVACVLASMDEHEVW